MAQRYRGRTRTSIHNTAVKPWASTTESIKLCGFTRPSKNSTEAGDTPVAAGAFLLVSSGPYGVCIIPLSTFLEELGALGLGNLRAALDSKIQDSMLKKLLANTVGCQDILKLPDYEKQTGDYLTMAHRGQLYRYDSEEAMRKYSEKVEPK